MDDPNYHAQNHPFTNQSCQHFSESSTNRRSGIGNRTLWSRSTYDDLPGVTQAPLSDLTHRPQGGPVTHQSQRPSGRVNREPCQVHGPPALFTQGRTGTVFSGPENFNHPSLENLRSTESAPSVLCSRQPSEFSSPCMSEELLGEPLGGGLLSTMPLSTVSSGSSESSLLDSQDYDFVEPLASKYECPICIQVLNNPVQTECGHRFCKACLLRWLGNQSSCRACPVCNMKLSEEQVFPDNFAKREINLLKVWCPHRGDGCSSIMELTHVQKHLAECDFSIVVCPNGCSGSLQRQKLKQHLVEKCPRRPVKCALCNSDIIFSEIKNHVTKNCPNSKVQCQFCGEEIQRRKADLHETECPQAVIPCTFADFGCSQKIPRGQVSNHHCIAQQDHLELIATALHSVMKSQGFEPPYNRMATQLTPVSPNTATTITTMHTTDALLVLARELMHCLPTMGAEGSSPLKGGLNPNELDSGTSAALEALLTSIANASIKSPAGQTENGNLGSNTNSKLPVATKKKKVPTATLR